MTVTPLFKAGSLSSLFLVSSVKRFTARRWSILQIPRSNSTGPIWSKDGSHDARTRSMGEAAVVFVFAREIPPMSWMGIYAPLGVGGTGGFCGPVDFGELRELP